MLPETPPGDAGLSLGVSVVKKITLLLMTMALAVAMVACSAAAGKPGPAGPKGDTGEPGEPPATTPEPGTTPGQAGPVQTITGIDDLIFNDSGTGEMDARSMPVNLPDHFYPAGLMYDYEPKDSEVVDITLSDDGMLSVMLKSAAKWENTTIKATATDGISSQTISFHARRNRPPVMTTDSVTGITTGTTPRTIDGSAQIPVWVGTMKSVELTIDSDGISGLGKSGDIPVMIDYTSAASTDAYFLDDVGNSLKLVPRPLPVDKAKQLMVDGGSKVVLTGKMSTNPDAMTESAILVSFVAEDDGGLTSAKEATILSVMVDTAPTMVTPIGDRIITLGDTLKATTILIIADFFSDDRETALSLSAKSSDPTVARIDLDGNTSTTAAGKDDKFAAITGANLVVVGINPGDATITVKATEPDSSGSPVGGMLEQSVEISFDVKVKQ